VDFSPWADAAVEEARRLAIQSAAAIELVYVWPTSPPSVDGDPPALSLDTILHTDVGRRMKEYLEEVEGDGITALGRVEAGVPEAVITDLAAREHFDLIVMGAHGQNAAVHARGGVCDHVAHHACCRVVTVERPTFHV
jgi:universal stress protein A